MAEDSENLEEESINVDLRGGGETKISVESGKEYEIIFEREEFEFSL